MGNGFKIERITSVEILKQCAEVLSEAYNGPPWNERWTTGTAEAVLTCYYNSPEFMGWKATSDNKIIGCGVGNIEPYYSGSVFYLRDLFVSVRSQKTGVGSCLVAAMKEDLAIIGIKTIILFTNRAIFDFYLKCGFNEMAGMSLMNYTNKNN